MESVSAAPGEKYGPYMVALDANGRPVSIDTSQVKFMQDSTDWYIAGQFPRLTRVQQRLVLEEVQVSPGPL